MIDKKTGLISILIVCLLLIGGCSLMTGMKEPKVIRDLAYDVTRKEDCIVYIEEDVFVPYLVLSSNYGGNTLLLRQYLLDEAMPFNVTNTHGWTYQAYGGYYEDSYIDHYLNTEFIEILSQPIRDALMDSTIIITDKSSLGVTGDAATVISRKIFLLSLRELNGPELRTSVAEGKVLKFFVGDHDRRVADFSDGKKSAYWTRTPETWETYSVFTIGNKSIGSGSADINSGVRPAFCLDSTTPIRQRSDIISGQTVYVLADTDS